MRTKPHYILNEKVWWEFTDVSTARAWLLDVTGPGAPSRAMSFLPFKSGRLSFIGGSLCPQN